MPLPQDHILRLQAHVVDGALTTLGVLNGSQSCAGAKCVPDVIHLIYKTRAFMDSTQRLNTTYMYIPSLSTFEHIISTYQYILVHILYILVHTLAIPLFT